MAAMTDFELIMQKNKTRYVMKYFLLSSETNSVYPLIYKGKRNTLVIITFSRLATL